MSFKQSKEQSVISKRFVSETELEEIKRKREEEWELARQQGRTIEKEEDVLHDGRTLYEKLKEQKDKKQEEFEEQLKFKNMIYKGLDKEDASFLSQVSSKQAEFHARRFDSDNIELQDYRAAVETMRTEEASKPAPLASRKNANVNASSKMQTMPKATAVIIRKRPSNTEKSDESKAKQAKEGIKNKDEDQNVESMEDKRDKELSESDYRNNQIPQTLKSLISYSDSEDDSDEN